MDKPTLKPANPRFSSGPCTKRPGWSWQGLEGALLGRSHRSKAGQEKLQSVIQKHRALLGIPDDYKIGIVPASDTGAIEMALWSMLGARPVEVLTWEHFSTEWLTDIQMHLKLNPVHHHAGYGALPDLTKVNTDNDIVFVWNGTTSGTRLPDGDWIKADRAGLTFCDATSAVFSYDLPWDKLDVTTWSWQKVLGGEAAHGMLVLSPRAIERLETYVPAWPLPKIFRLTKNKKLDAGIFEGLTINTPSMMAVEDCLDALNWVEGVGGLSATIKRSQDNLRVVENWVEKESAWISFLDPNPQTRARTSITLTITDPDFVARTPESQTAIIKEMCAALEQENVAYDIKNYVTAPAGFRIWGGATVESADLAALLPWIKWVYKTAR